MTPWIDKDAIRRGERDIGKSPWPPSRAYIVKSADGRSSLPPKAESPIDPQTNLWRCRWFGHKWGRDVAHHGGAPFRFAAYRCSRCGAKT